jgi:hypothetical protein
MTRAKILSASGSASRFAHGRLAIISQAQRSHSQRHHAVLATERVQIVKWHG